MSAILVAATPDELLPRESRAFQDTGADTVTLGYMTGAEPATEHTSGTKRNSSLPDAVKRF